MNICFKICARGYAWQLCLTVPVWAGWRQPHKPYHANIIKRTRTPHRQHTSMQNTSHARTHPLQHIRNSPSPLRGEGQSHLILDHHLNCFPLVWTIKGSAVKNDSYWKRIRGFKYLSLILDYSGPDSEPESLIIPRLRPRIVHFPYCTFPIPQRLFLWIYMVLYTFTIWILRH